MLAGQHHSYNCAISNGKIVFFTTVFHLPLFCYAWGQHGLHGAQIVLPVRIADALSGRARLGRREGECWVKDWEETDVPAHYRTEGKGAGPSTFA